MNVDKLRYLIRTAIECAVIYRRRRPMVARAQLEYARELRERLYDLLAQRQEYEVSEA